MISDEKFIQGSTEPLVLRPPVGSEVYDQPGVRFRALFGPQSDPRRRRRFLCHCLWSILLALIAVTVLLFVMFMIGAGPLFSRVSPKSLAYQSQLPYSSCRVLIPMLRVRLTELISPMDNMFNVTMLEDSSFSGIQTIRILHLCKDGLTVIRNNDRCYIRPMREGWRRLCSDSFTQRMRTVAAISPQIEARLDDEQWFIDESPNIPNVINNSYIMAWCEGVPAFRLVSNPPPEGFTLYTSSAETKPTFEDPPFDEDSDRAEVFNELLSPGSPVLLNSNDDSLLDPTQVRLGRRARQLNLNQAMGVKPDQIYVADRGHRMREPFRPVVRETRAAGPKMCKEITTVLEDATVVEAGDTGPSSVTRDHILRCHP